MRIRHRFVSLVAAFILLLFSGPPRLEAQTAAPPESLRGQLVALGGPLGSGQAMSTIATLASLEVSTTPLGTSTGGFTFTFDPLLRIWKRSSSSYGPAFAERSLTTGKAKVSAGFNWLHAAYDELDDQDLKNGEFRLARNISGFAPAPTVNYSALALDLSSDTIVPYAHVGLTDRLDVGVAIPFVTVRLAAEGGLFTSTGAQVAGSVIPETRSSGVGDIAIFGKYQVVRQDQGGVALAVELRLPTGDYNNLRGLDITRTLVSGIWSHSGRVSPHVNVGYEFWSSDVAISQSGDVAMKNAFKYSLGVEIEAHPRATIVLDLVGRNLMQGGKLGYQTFAGSGGSSIDALVGLPEGIQQVSLAPGLKWNVWRSVLITGNLLASVSNSSLDARVIPVVGLDWAF